MSNIIHFRTHKKGGSTGTISPSKIRGTGSEYDGIRDAEPYDDARDIAWKQSLKGGSLYIKTREDSSDTRVILGGVYDASWDFSIEQNDDKHTYYKNLDILCRKSADESRIKYMNLGITHDTKEYADTFFRVKPRNTLLIIVSSSFAVEHYDDLIPFAHINDIIIVHLLHSYEAFPEKYQDILIESHLIDTKKYSSLIEKQKTKIQNFLSENGIGYITTTHSEDPVVVLNNYFKYRYAR